MTVPEGPTFTILDEIRQFIVPLTCDAFLQLEKNLVEQGCREALVVWRKSEQELVIIDGHNRFAICQKNNIPFDYTVLEFDDIEQVKVWMVNNQIGRRNLTQDQLRYYRGLKYLSLKMKKGGFQNTKSKENGKTPTSILLSKEFNVSSSTIKRDASFAEILNIVGESNPNLKTKILMGEINIKKSILESLSKDRQKAIEDLESYINRSTHHSRTVASNQDTLKRVRGMIFSVINRIISNRNIEDLNELKLLVGKLERELFKLDT